MVKEIVKNHDVVFSNRPKTTATDILHYGTKDFGFAPYGEYWKQVKKISVLELFSIEESNRFSSSGTKKLGVIIDKIRGACRKGESVNLSDMFLFVSNNIVSRCVISRKIEEDGGTCSKMGLLARRSAVLLTSFCVGDMFPYLRWLDNLTGLIPNLKALSRELDAYFDQIIEEHEASRSNNGEVTGKKGLCF
ncbi:hypothetical protein V6N13_021427 [Hibiscus sabdariffa]